MSRFDREIELQNLMRQLAARAPDPTVGVVEVRLRAACRRKRSERVLRAGLLALAACLLIALGLAWYSSARRVPAPDETYAGFIALPYAQSDVPIEQTVVVRVSLQPGDLKSLGLPATAVSRKNSMQQADLLIGQDGMARAVRFTEQ